MSGNSAKFTRQIFLWQAQVNADPKLAVSGVKFGFALSSHFNEAEGGAAWPGIEEIGKAMGRSKPVVIEGRQHIVAAGHLRFQPGSRGSGHSGRYWMILKGNPDLPFTEQEKVTPPYLSTSGKGSPSKTEKVARPKWKGNPGLHKSSTKPSKEPPKQQPRAREEESGEKKGHATEYDVIEHALRRAAGLESTDNLPGLRSLAPILTLLGTGYDLAEDVLPAIVARRGKRFSSWAYFVEAIKEAKAKRLNGGSHAEPAAKPATAKTDELRWRRFFDAWARGGDSSWFMSWEPGPGGYGCPIPNSVLLAWLGEIARSPDAPMHVTSAIKQIEARHVHAGEAQPSADTRTSARTARKRIASIISWPVSPTFSA